MARMIEALRLHRDLTVDVASIPAPAMVAGEVRVRTAAARVCGSDLHAVRSDRRARSPDAAGPRDRCRCGGAAPRPPRCCDRAWCARGSLIARACGRRDRRRRPPRLDRSSIRDCSSRGHSPGDGHRGLPRRHLRAGPRREGGQHRDLGRLAMLSGDSARLGAVVSDRIALAKLPRRLTSPASTLGKMVVTFA